MPLVYSHDRVRRLRLVLGVEAVAGVLLFLLAALGAADDTTRDLAVGFGLLGLVVVALAVVALRSLPRRDRRAKVTAVAAGAVALLVSPLFSGVIILSLAFVMTGLAVIALALLRDDPDLVA